MRIVIMADGKGMRWSDHLGVPKHFARIGGERIIERTVRLLKTLDTEGENELIVTSHDIRYEFSGCRRHEPKDNIYEIDRFTDELIEDDMCFLYGDTYYTEGTLNKILETGTDSVLFFGNEESIVGVKIKDAGVFREHKEKVKKLYLEGEIDECRGWQIFRSVTGQEFGGAVSYDKNFIFTDRETKDINTPLDYEEIVI